MALKPFQTKLIQLYRDQELQLVDLYEKLAQAFPSHAATFQMLANEEREHAGWIGHLETSIQNGTASFSEGKTRTYTITTLISYVGKLIESLERGEMDLQKALTLVVDIERSLIERQVFERFDGDSDEVERILKILNETQQGHLARIEQFARQTKCEGACKATGA